MKNKKILPSTAPIFSTYGLVYFLLIDWVVIFLPDIGDSISTSSHHQPSYNLDGIQYK